MGRGAFATTDIMPGTVIGDYLGIVMPTPKAIKTEPMGTYYMEITDTHSVLADKDDLGIQIINHSCTPNCGSDNYRGHILYFALRKIFAGEELTVNYNFGPPDRESCNPCRHSCQCNSMFCTGSMHTAASKDSLITFEYSKHSEFFKKAIEKLDGKMLPRLKNYPRKLNDDSFFDLFGYEKQSPTVLQNKTIPTVKKLREVIRDRGRTIAFPKFGLRVHGVTYSAIISTALDNL